MEGCAGLARASPSVVVAVVAHAHLRSGAGSLVKVESWSKQNWEESEPRVGAEPWH